MNRFSAAALTALCVANAFALTACGGGGGGEGGAKAAPPGVSFTASPPSIDSSADAGSSSKPTAVINLSISSLPDAGLYVDHGIEHAGINTADFEQTSNTTATLTITFVDPAIIGPGTYDGTLSIRMCHDDACARHVTGSPKTIPVKYRVTGVQAPMPALVVPSKAISAEGLSFTHTSPSASIAFNFTDNTATQDFSVSAVHSGAGIGDVFPSTVSGASGSFTVSFKSPTLLGRGVYKDTITLTASCTRGCARGIRDANQVVNAEYAVSNSKSGPDGYTVNFVALPANDLTWSAVHEKIYVSVPSDAGAHGNSVAALNPSAATIEASSFVGSEPTVLDASDDGQYLYVGLGGSNSIRRKRLPDLAQDILIPIANDPVAGALFANDVQVAPGHSETIAVARRTTSNFSGTSAGISIYDNAVQRADIAGGFGNQPALNWLRWATDTKIYASTSENSSYAMSEINADSTGAHVVHTQLNVGDAGNFGRLHVAGSVLYSDGGEAYDPVARIVLGRFKPSDTNWSRGVVPDSALKKLFMLVHGPNGAELQSFNLETFTPIARANVYVGLRANSYTRLIRWGTDGLAFTTDDGRVVLVNGAFVTSPVN